MGILQLIRGSNKKSQTKQTPGVIVLQREALATDTGKLRDLWDGSDAGVNFVSPMAYTAVAVPRTLVGAPIFSSADRVTQAWLDSFYPYVLDNAPVITQTKLIVGTAWRFPMWDAHNHTVIWRAIPDDEIISIKTDIDTGEITDIYTEAQVERTREWFDKDVMLVKRHYNRKSIMTETETEGHKVERENYFGILPLPFGHDCFEGEFRGTSIFARAYRTMKSTHDIIFNRDLILSTFKPKMIQTVSEASQKAVEAWKTNNGIKEHLDPFDHELFVNMRDENTQFLFLPSDATAQHTAAIENNLKRVILGSGVPELFYGMLATGTQAANDAQVRLAVEYIKDLRREDVSWYRDLINYSARIYGYANAQRFAAIDTSYTNLDMLSTLQRSTVFNTYASGIATLMNARTLTPESAMYFTELFFSDYPHKTAEEFIDGMARLTAAVPSQYEGGEVF